MPVGDDNSDHEQLAVECIDSVPDRMAVHKKQSCVYCMQIYFTVHIHSMFYDFDENFVLLLNYIL